MQINPEDLAQHAAQSPEFAAYQEAPCRRCLLRQDCAVLPEPIPCPSLDFYIASFGRKLAVH
jgi:hypothetical protein